jgi:hypothetical protein
MYIVVVEDDHNQAAWIEARLKERFPEAEFRRVKTEHEFRSLSSEFAQVPPDIVIMDVMLRWTDPSPNQPARPERVKEEGPFKAGLRCQEIFASIPGCGTVPVLLYTVLEEKDLRKELGKLTGLFVHLRKDSDAGPLLESVVRLALPKI